MFGFLFDFLPFDFPPTSSHHPRSSYQFCETADSGEDESSPDGRSAEQFGERDCKADGREEEGYKNLGWRNMRD